MATYVCLIQFTDQGIRNIKDTVKRGDAAMAEAEKMGMKIVDEFWTMGAYDGVVTLEAPNDETVSACERVYSQDRLTRQRQGPHPARFSPERDGKHSGEIRIAAIRAAGERRLSQTTPQLTLPASGDWS